MALLEVEGLEVAFPVRGGEALALRGVDLALDRGERLGIVGESGAGKSMLGFAILDLIAEPGHISAGHIRFDGQDLLALEPEALRHVRGNRISMIFQDPMATLNPVLTVERQMVETLEAHDLAHGTKARARALAMLRTVQIPAAEARLGAYPHELSGGLRQRVVIAIALLTEPEVVIADEPTTALDVTIQAEIMGLLLRLCRERGVGLILITHDLGVVAEVTERLMILYAGRAVEAGPTAEVIGTPRHPYTAGLIGALPGHGARGRPLAQIRGSMPGIAALPTGCAFHPRCDRASERCSVERPLLSDDGARRLACFHPLGGQP